MFCRQIRSALLPFNKDRCFAGLVARCFAKRRVVVDDAYLSKIKETSNAIKLHPYNKIKTISKLSHLPYSHVLKALCVKEGKEYILKDELGYQHVFNDERDIIVPYSIASAYLTKCKKESTCVEIDPENIHEKQNEKDRTIQKQVVISVVGEMDHGKTTLLDSFLHSSIQKQEYGGTTQLIRANEVLLTSESLQQKCTFLDTPGQSCFSFIRDNGSILSDFSLYLVSLLEGPTEEAHRILQQLQENGNPVVIIFTKRDLVDQIRENQIKNQVQQLASKYHIPIAHMHSISSVTGEGIKELQSYIIQFSKQVAKTVSLSAPAEATILDSSLIPSQGIVLKALVQQGVLSVRNPFICGLYTGNVRKLENLQNQSVQKAYPGTVVNILGARKLPASLRKTIRLLPTGDTLFVRKQEEIESIWNHRYLEYLYQSSLIQDRPVEEEELTGEMEIINGEEYYEVKLLPVIVVADNANSMNILIEKLQTIPGVSIVNTRIGQITEGDIQQCMQSTIRIVSFNVPLPEKARKPTNKKFFYHSRIMSDLLEEIEKEFS